jgi:hypothetical protein
MTARTTNTRLAIALLLLWIAGSACGDPRAQPALAAMADHRPTHVDSVFPIAEEIRRFRVAIPDSVDALAGAAPSRDELVVRFLTALEAGDRAALNALAITVEEFAYLYYPHTRFTRPPYELSPALVWFQVDTYGSRGLDRVMTRLGGKAIRTDGYVCPPEPEVEGENQTWNGCLVRHRDDAGRIAELSLFGPILERGGRFKFVSYANTL